jgi:peptidase C39-like protein
MCASYRGPRSVRSAYVPIRQRPIVVCVVLTGLLAAACGGAPARSPIAGPSAASASEPASAAPSASEPAAAAPAASAPAPAAPAPAVTPTPRSLVGAAIDLHEIVFSATDGDSAISDWYEPSRTFTRLVPSWSADTPAGTWLTVEMQARRVDGGMTRWWSFGTWASGDGEVRRSSVAGQIDGDGTIDVDTFEAAAPMGAYRMRVALHRSPSGAAPTLRQVRAVTSDDARGVPVGSVSPSARTSTIDLAVPTYSQEIHRGEHPEYDGGGEAWCSPTSTAMVVAFWGKAPTPDELAWAGAGHADPQVDVAARGTYDVAYAGTGNWSFNVGYASRFGLDAFVTRLRSLNEAERFIDAGIPLVASIKVGPGALPGFLLPEGSDGHLVVIRGFTQAGDPIVNDPAATSDAAVRRIYPRGAFERAWLDGSRGTVYVIRPPSLSLPARALDTTSNW